MQLNLKIFCLVFIFISCKHSIDDFLKPLSPIYANCLASIDVRDSLKVLIPDNTYNFFHNTQILNDSLFYGINIFSPLRINVINLKTKEFVKTIDLDKNLLQTYEVNQFRVFTQDSIYISTYPNKGLFLVNSSGCPIKKWTDDDLNISSNVDDKFYKNGLAIADLSGLENFEIIGDSCYITVSPVSPKDFEGSPKLRRHGIYDLKNNCWVSLYAPYEGVLKYKGSDVYFYDMHKPYRKVKGDKIYVSYPIDHNVYVYDFVTHNLLYNKSVAPSFAVDFPPPIPCHSRDNDALLNNLRKKTPFYGPLYYHSKVNCWSRFYNFFDADILYRGIVVYNEDFKIIGEKVFFEKEFANITPYSNGFVLMTDNSNNDDYSIFIIYEIKL